MAPSMVPIPRFATWEAFNLWLEAQCLKRQSDVLRGHSENIGQPLARDLDALCCSKKWGPLIRTSRWRHGICPKSFQPCLA